MNNNLEIATRSLEKALDMDNLPIESLVVPEAYQRTLRPLAVRKLVKDFNISKLDPIKVSFRDGVRYIIDGQHRYRAMEVMGYTTISCIILRGLTEAQEAEIFSSQGKNTTRISQIEKFKAEKVAGLDRALAIAALLEDFEIAVVAGKKGGSRDYITSIKCVQAIYDTYGYTVLAEVISIAKQAWGNNAVRGGIAFNKVVLMGLAQFLKKSETSYYDKKHLITKLSKVSMEHIILEVTTSVTCVAVILGLYNKGKNKSSATRLIF